ncbi:methionyl-tRNA formyltransferase [Campylobacter mucosalis]|uniref:Methionyl-tRNA formyltransferase n=1 Tax=Campylobacter mucosalis CCUG 21559 TaxID=1032067 RepID=A0A6G5QF51_9BACT|nr:methionyl-tRNA formyltransferase [Campylobacter mucosalis]QCD44281.1 10-formyltetrahydrofolate:L-methionyl-tRNA(fMet) N-formyltransferase [Campylobacter mucosalis CCUG 21559]
MDVVFMGTPEYATKILRNLIKNQINISAVFTQPDKPVGRKQILTPPDVKAFLIQNHPDIKIHQPKNLKDPQTTEFIFSLKPDFIVVAAYGQILPQSILDIAPCINLHASILPKYRGASPIQSAILDGQTQTGVTSMLMDAGLDTGMILQISKTECGDKTSGELFDELGDMAAELIIDTLKNFHTIQKQPQDESKSSICKKIKKEMGLFDFNQTTKEIYNKFRAFTPWPGMFLSSGLKILSLKPSSLKGNVGEILQIAKNSIIVGTSDASVEIFTLQEPSKKSLDAPIYINGKRLGVGDRIS